MKVDKQFAAVMVAIVMLVSVLSAGIVMSVGEAESDIILVRIEDASDLDAIRENGLNVLERYNDFALVRASEQAGMQLKEDGLNVNMLPGRTEISVKGHQFDINDGMPDFPDELTMDGYESGEEGIYIVHMLGPVNPEWSEEIESAGAEIINYQPNFAYEVKMTPEIAESVEDFDFVDWVGVYQPGFKLEKDIEPGMVSIEMVDGNRMVTEIQDESEFAELAQMNDVYYISTYHEPELHDEMATQIVGGGLWVYEPDGDPDSAYRGEGQYGSHATQLGYDGSGYVTAVADTGLGDGTTGDAGHPDFDGRVVGGYDFDDETTAEGSWSDGHGHGTHCTGSVAGHTHGGTGDTVYEDYYSAEGLAPGSDLFAARIFDDGGGWCGPDDYREIVWVTREHSDPVVHSNSWGAETEGEYTDSDADFDEVTRDGGDGDPMTIVVAAGNAGPGARGGGYNSVGSPAVGKNIISVAASENYPDGDPDNIAGFSSRGWTDDNRVKPELTAPGQDIYSTEPGGGYQYMSGTSMACPAVAGAATSLVDWYEDTYNTEPNPSMVKALMINTAYNLANDNGGENSPHIPNQDEGWGMVNLPQIVDAPVDFMLEDESQALQTGEVDEYDIEYQDGNEPLRISLTWTDEPAASGDDPTLINDLNLEVISPTGQVYRGNNLVESWSEPGESTYDTFDSNDDGWDDVNNVENVYIRDTDLEDGTYTVRVHGFDVPVDVVNGGQDYSLVKYNAVESDAEPGPLAPTDPEPEDGATDVGTDVELSVYVEHEDGDRMDVDFYDADDSLIGSEGNVQSGDRAYTTWSGLDHDTSYDWYAVADDGDQTATSTTWSFTTTSATPPDITLTRPTGGETWTAGDNEDITWDSTEGDGAITGVDLDYSLDGGDSWTNIVTDTEDDGVYTWAVPDEETEEAMIEATIHDDLGSSDTDTSGTLTIEGTTPPEITLTRPTGGEEWNAGDNEEITWDTTVGDGTITDIDLEYTTDDGDSWNVIVEGTADDGSYMWTVPDEATDEARVRATVNDDNDLSGEDTSEMFTILGTPPESPEYLEVERVGSGDTEELVDNGHFEDGDDPWQMIRDPQNIGNDEGQAGWVDDEQYQEGGSIWAMAEQEGDGSSTEEVIWEQEIDSTTDEITVNGAYMKNLYIDRDDCSITGIVSIFVYDTGVEDWVDIYEVETNEPDTTGWVEFGPDMTYTPEGEVTSVMAGLYVDAVGNSRGPNLDTASGEIWMDAISVTTESGTGEGDEDNLITWGASPDEPDVVEYNVYRSEGEDEAGPYELIATVDADDSAEYEYVDPDRGTADDVLWWYIVHAVDEQDQECEGAGPVQEPGEELETFEISLTSDEADGWNFVSFNLDLEDNDLESILEDEDNGISGNYDKVMYYDATADEWYSYVPGRAEHFNNIDTWDHTMGIWIQMNEVDTLTVEGHEPEETTISLEAGWNMVSYPSSEVGTGVPEQVTQIGYFDAGEEYNVAYTEEVDTFEFTPGDGYWLYTEEPTEWTVEY